VSDIIRDNRKRAYMKMLHLPFYERGRSDPNPIQLIPNAERSEPYTGERPRVQGVPPVPGQPAKTYKANEIA
jgi:hypothetical protein